MVVFLAILAFLGWSGFVICICVIFAGAARGLAEADRDLKQARKDRAQAFGRGHV